MGAVTRRFCSLESQQRGEPLVGKGGIDQPHLLLAWPRRKWSDHIFDAKDMPEAVSSRLEVLREQGWRVQLIDRRGQDHGTRRLLMPMSGWEYAAEDGDLPGLLDALRMSEVKAMPWRIGPTAKSILLCCTHGKIDLCCAKFGNAAYQAIQAENALRGYGFDVWESSHVGGCRLAANVVALPGIRRYGRVTPEVVPELLASEKEGHAYLPCFRGVAGLNSLQQCADLAARYWLTSQGMDAELSVAEVTDPQVTCDISVTVHWRGAEEGGNLVVHCRSWETDRYSGCDELANGDARPTVCWMARSVEPLNPEEASL